MVEGWGVGDLENILYGDGDGILIWNLKDE